MEEKNNGSKSIVILLLFLVIGLSGYIVYSKLSVKEPVKTNETGKTEEVETLNVKSNFVKDLYEKARFKSIDCFALDDNMTKDYLKVTDFSDTQKMKVVGSNISLTNLNYDDEGGSTLSEEIFKKAFYEVFGNNVEYTPLTNLKESATCPYVKYDSKNKEYKLIGGCGNVCGQYQIENIVEATKYSDKLEITTATAYFRGGTDEFGIHEWYYDKDFKNLISNSAEPDFIQYKDKLQKYKYTFTLDKETGNYYYYSIEKINK